MDMAKNDTKYGSLSTNGSIASISPSGMRRARVRVRVRVRVSVQYQ